MNVHLLDDPDEMTSRWSGTFIGVKKEEGVLPLLVNSFRKTMSKGYIVEGSYSTNFDEIEKVSVNDLVFKMPSFGVINHDDTTFLIRGIPKRQWKRGFKHTLVLFNDPFQKENSIRNKHFSNRMLTKYDFISSIFNPVYYPINQCINDVREFKALSRAFNNKFAIGIRSGYSNPRVLYKGIDVGGLTSKNIVMLRQNSIHIFEELSQYLECSKGK